jgi:adenosylcobyric acid synthase
MAERLAGAPCLGVVPHFAAAAALPAEDSLALAHHAGAGKGGCVIAVPRLPRIANFDDLDPLKLEPDVELRIVPPGEPLPLCDLLILPGSKSTVSDLAALRQEGWDIDILGHARRGGAVLGLCGGYQMLGRLIHDPLGSEGPAGTVAGLGLLDTETTLLPDKTLTRVEAVHVPSGMAMTGYEIHLGKSTGADCQRPFAMIGGQPDGAISMNGRIMGTYLHGCFAADGFRSAFLKQLGANPSDLDYEAKVEATLDALAAHLERHLDIERLLALAGVVSL